MGGISHVFLKAIRIFNELLALTSRQLTENLIRNLQEGFLHVGNEPTHLDYDLNEVANVLARRPSN